MNLFELFVKIGVEDTASGKLKVIGESLGNGLKTAAKIGTAAVGAAATGIAALTTAAVNNYAEYEQLVGGAQLMFGKAYDTVAKNAQDAYKTVQMSQNEYLQQVNGFATGLKTALGGNEEAAADLAHRIIQAEADIVAATGNTQENVANAFNGIMKSNFTMLDNLQIGITPTKEGFQEVIDKVNEWNKANGEATDYQMGNLADMQSALVDYIDMVGMSGYAQREAAQTITGSLASAKSAWNNLITGLADGNADIGKLVDNLVTTIVGDGTEKNLGVLGNIMPAIKTALNGASRLVSELLPVIVAEIPAIISGNLPVLASAAVSVIQSLADGISQNSDLLVGAVFGAFESIISEFPALIESFTKLIPDLLDSILEELPGAIETIVTALTDGSVIENLVSAVVGIVQAIADNLPTIIQAIVDAIPVITESVNNAILNNFPALLQAIIQIVLAIVQNLPTIIQMLVDQIPTIVSTIVQVIVENLPMFISGIVQIIAGLVKALPSLIVSLKTSIYSVFGGIGRGLVSAWPQFWEGLKEVWEKFTSWFDAKKNQVKEIGKNIVDGLKGGIKNAWANLKSWFKNLFGDLIGVAKKILGIASPSKVFKKLGFWTADGFGIGFEDEFAHVKDDMEYALNFDDASVGINASIRKVGAGAAGGAFGGTSIGNITINIDGAKYSNEQSLAEAVAEAIQSMTDRRAAVYA